MKLPDVRPYFQEQIGRIFEVSLFGRIGIEPEVAQRRRKDIVGRIQHVNAALFEFRQALRFENDVPTVDFGLGTQNLLNHFDVVADAGSAPHVVGGVLVAWIIGGKLLQYERPSVAQVRSFDLSSFWKTLALIWRCRKY